MRSEAGPGLPGACEQRASLVWSEAMSCLEACHRGAGARPRDSWLLGGEALAGLGWAAAEPRRARGGDHSGLEAPGTPRGLTRASMHECQEAQVANRRAVRGASAWRALLRAAFFNKRVVGRCSIVRFMAPLGFAQERR